MSFQKPFRNCISVDDRPENFYLKAIIIHKSLDALINVFKQSCKILFQFQQRRVDGRTVTTIFQFVGDNFMKLLKCVLDIAIARAASNYCLLNNVDI